MSEKMFTKEQLEDSIKKAVVMTKDFLADKDMSGAELYESHKDHFTSFLIPEGISLQDIHKKVKAEDNIKSYYPDWVEEEPSHPWHDKVAKRFCNSLSDIQKIALKAMLSHDNRISFNDIKKALIDGGVKWTSSNTLGGSLGGLSRKCVYRYEIPYVYSWNEDEEYYFIVPEALPFIQKYLV